MPSLSKMKCRRSLASLVVVVAAFLFPMTVSALTLTEYQHRLKEAVTDLDVLTPADEHVTDSEFKNRLLQAIDAVRAALPEHMTIEENGETYAVDNTALHKTLEDLKSLSTDDQIKKINDLKRTLSALETRVAERIAATPTGETKEQSKLRLARILWRPEEATGPPRGDALPSPHTARPPPPRRKKRGSEARAPRNFGGAGGPRRPPPGEPPPGPQKIRGSL